MPTLRSHTHLQATQGKLQPKLANVYDCGSNGCCSDFIMTANYALESWKKSSGHNAVIVNQGIWDDNKWNAIGIGLFKGFAVVWFGNEIDNE